MKYFHWFLLTGMSLGHLSLRAQSDIPIGAWRTHFSFRDNHSIITTEKRVYSAGSNSLFYYDRMDGSLNQISKIDGLSETDIRDIGYHDRTETFLIAYGNGVIDLLRDNRITVIDDLRLNAAAQEIVISDMDFLQELAYLSSNIGVIVLDLVKQEIREVYQNIGPGGTELTVNGAAIINDSLFIATDQGVMGGSLSPSVNLLDFNNWRRFDSSDGLPSTETQAIQAFNDRIWAAIDFTGIYYYQGQTWQQFNLDLTNPVQCMTANPDELIITTDENLMVISPDEDLKVIDHPLFNNPRCAVRDQGILWVADSINGLISNMGNEYLSLFPNGPFTDQLDQARFLDEHIVSLGAGYDPFRRPMNNTKGFNFFKEGGWENFNDTGAEKVTNFPPIPNLVDVTWSDNLWYFASFGAGIVQWDEENNITVLDHETPGSTLIATGLPNNQNVLISGVERDTQGNIWALNYGNPFPLHRFQPLENQWTAFSSSFSAGRFALDLDLTEAGEFWLTLDPKNGGGILVLNPESGQERWLKEDPGEGGLPSNRVLDLAIDLEGQIWVGTDEGIALFPFPFDLLSRPQVDAQTIFIDGRPLLRDQTVTSLAVDGGNRKWIGTENGLWLFSEFGDSVIHNFTSSNSPLPNDLILDVELNPSTGEVFIVTPSGMVSFRSDATRGTTRHQQVKIFPNPVTRDFTGSVGISGLTNNSVIKITDITGKLVSEFRANGGTAAWNVADLSGSRVKSGVYLVFSSSIDGSETFVGKIAVFN